MWQKLSYIYNNFFYYNNLSITFLNYCTIEKSPLKALYNMCNGMQFYLSRHDNFFFFSSFIFDMLMRRPCWENYTFNPCITLAFTTSWQAHEAPVA